MDVREPGALALGSGGRPDAGQTGLQASSAVETAGHVGAGVSPGARGPLRLIWMCLESWKLDYPTLSYKWT